MFTNVDEISKQSKHCGYNGRKEDDEDTTKCTLNNVVRLEIAMGERRSASVATDRAFAN